LFLIYINDLPNEISNECKSYADDNKVIAEINSQLDAEKLQDDINKIDLWSETWQL
jgi:hypothetical protein